MGCKISKGDYFFLSRVLFSNFLFLQNFCFMDLKLTPSSSLFHFFYIIFAYRMARAHEEVSTSQAGRRRGTLRETPTARSLVAAMYA